MVVDDKRSFAERRRPRFARGSAPFLFDCPKRSGEKKSAIKRGHAVVSPLNNLPRLGEERGADVRRCAILLHSLAEMGTAAGPRRCARRWFFLRLPPQQRQRSGCADGGAAAADYGTPGCIRGPQAPCVVSRGLQRGKHEIPLCRVFSHRFSARAEKRCPRRETSGDMRRAEVVAPYGRRRYTYSPRRVTSLPILKV